jgi:DNA invertase Pin-like site-specific DNA recombinase
MKAAIYVRISPTYRDKEETITGMAKSIESALEICRRKARGEDDEIVEEYVDQYVSGKSQEHMKEFQRMVQDAHRNHFQRIYCRRVDRFGRNLNEMNLRSVIDMKNKGMTWANISDYVNVSVPTIQRRLKDAGYTFERGRVIKA